jgi:hypothetical protein
VGRMPVIAALAELTEDALVQILTEPKNALIKQFGKLLSMEGVDLEKTSRRYWCTGKRRRRLDAVASCTAVLVFNLSARVERVAG